MRSRLGSPAVFGLIVVASLCIGQGTIRAAEPTAFELAKEGNRYVGEQAKDKVLQIRSDKSIGSTVPNMWYVLYYDPTATFKAVEVEFGGGRMMGVKRPLRLLEPVRGTRQPLDVSKLKIDSDQALKIALAEPVLERVTVRATSALLERGEAEQVVWKVRVWAAKLRHPNEQADIGEVILSAEDGRVIKNDLRIKRVD
jgi:hypothetical protein